MPLLFSGKLLIKSTSEWESPKNPAIKGAHSPKVYQLTKMTFFTK